MSAVIRVENLAKRYRLGVINRTMLYHDIQSWWAKLRGKEDPNSPLVRKNKGREPGDDGFLWALRDVSFDVKDGEVVGVIGRNGAGKSTLLKILSQITAPTSGRALIKGHIASLLEVGTGFHQELTGRENVYLNGAILGMTKRDIDRRYDEIAAFSGVEKFLDTPIKRYSSGMKVRLAFSVAAHLEPEILIIDEVLAVGDAAFQAKCIGKLGDVAREGRTVLFVSHNMAAIENLCSRTIVLEEGSVVFDGSQADGIHHYLESCIVQHGSLRERTDRAGTGDLRVVAIEFRNGDGKPTSTALSGQEIEICLHFENKARKSFPKLRAQITVRNEIEVPVFAHDNLVTGDNFGDIPESGVFICRIPRLPLPPTTYHIDYVVTAAKFGGALDRMQNAVELTVEPGDFFGTGRHPRLGKSVCLVDGTWRMEPAKDPAVLPAAV
jgi:homopolymeric O-antigen transport system ATP-binding protein